MKSELSNMDMRQWLSETKKGVSFDVKFSEIMDIPVREYSTDISVVMAYLNENNYWFHISHNNTMVIPTKQSTGFPYSNAERYDERGKPVRYTSLISNVNDIAYYLCVNIIKAKYDFPDAYMKYESGVEQQNKEFRMFEYKAPKGKFTDGPWYPGHLGDETIKCECRSIVSETCMGGVAEVFVDNGLPISDGGNDAPPREEAIANMHLISTAPQMFDMISSILEGRDVTKTEMVELLNKATNRC